MKPRYVHGNLLEAPETHIIHGCNAQGEMGSGVAKLIRDLYPDAYDVYRDTYNERGLVVGEIIPVECGPHVVINAITQEYYGRAPGAVYVSYEQGIRFAFRAINDLAKEDPEATFAMPLIGAGLAGGDWKRIIQIIDEEATDFTPVVYLIDGKIPA